MKMLFTKMWAGCGETTECFSTLRLITGLWPPLELKGKGQDMVPPNWKGSWRESWRGPPSEKWKPLVEDSIQVEAQGGDSREISSSPKLFSLSPMPLGTPQCPNPTQSRRICNPINMIHKGRLPRPRKMEKNAMCVWRDKLAIFFSSAVVDKFLCQSNVRLITQVKECILFWYSLEKNCVRLELLLVPEMLWRN